jgi:uncharacterized HAD superfamily protein
MNIGINLDSVIANTNLELQLRLDNLNISTNVNDWDNYLLSENINIDKHWIEDLYNDSLYWANAIPNEDAWNMINKWFYAEFDIYIISTRPARQFDISEWWLERWFIPYNKIICGALRGSKNTYIDMFNLDLFIEDDPYESNILCKNIPTIIVNKNYNIKNYNDEIVRADDCYAVDLLLEKYFTYDN